MLERDATYYAAELERCKLRPESARRIRQRLQTECGEASRGPAPKFSILELAPRNQEVTDKPKATCQRNASSILLKTAACLVVVAISAGTIAANVSPLNASSGTAEADAPLLPYQRIQFDFDSEAAYMTPEGVYITVPVLLAFPGNMPASFSLSIYDTNGVCFSAEKFTGDNSQPRPLQVNSSQRKATLYATFLSDIDPWKYANEGDTAPDGWTWNPTQAIELIERLRDCTIIAETTAGERFAFSIDLDDYPAQSDIADRLYSKVGYPLVYFALDEKRIYD